MHLCRSPLEEPSATRKEECIAIKLDQLVNSCMVKLDLPGKDSSLVGRFVLEVETGRVLGMAGCVQASEHVSIRHVHVKPL